MVGKILLRSVAASLCEDKTKSYKNVVKVLLFWTTLICLAFLLINNSSFVQDFHNSFTNLWTNGSHLNSSVTGVRGVTSVRSVTRSLTEAKPRHPVFKTSLLINQSSAVSHDVTSTQAHNITQSSRVTNLTQSSYLSQTNLGCYFPKVDPFDKALQNITKTHPPIDCSKQTPHLVYVQGDTIFINFTKIKSSPQLNSTFKHCQYIARVRDLANTNDRKTKVVGDIQVFNHSINVSHDYVVVECFNKSNKIISRSYLTFIRKKPNLESELKAKYEAHVELHAPKETLSVMMVGIDAMSKNNFQRAMPKTRNFLLETMKAVELYKHNKFGHNTFPNVVGLLTGNNEESLVKLNYSFDMPMDNVNHAFLWSAYRNAGYRTGMFLDMTEITAFHYQKKGWTNPPVDYYFREVVVDSEKDKLMRKDGDCIGDVPDIRLLTDYWVQLASLFNNSKTEPYFTYSFSARLTHDDENRASAADELYFQFLQTLVDKKVLNNTVLVFFSDHGPRFGAIRSTYNGMLEGRMPYMFLVFPPWFHTKYPQLMEVVKTNQHRLTTHTDVYETLIDLLYFKAETGKGSLTQPRISLFKEIPEGRTCQHALIPLEYCVCNSFSKTNVSSSLGQYLGLALMARVNKYIPEKLKTLCKTLTLSQVTSVMEMVSETPQTRRYQVTVTSHPNSAVYEGVLNQHRDNVTTVEGDVTRLNLYRGQAECIEDPKLRPFCYCDPSVTKQSNSS
ncbi:uncharacterized protein LOC131934930 [Physella acuta]|uniref:uncharacterized protein LOC131934930 n=1 Tax=Physella acuta TaxID=109671 RepID=UPI0027DE742B|nr:uncharacterized protein LOC131934930 [Physella acuta]